MSELRVMLIGGTSNVGKSTLAQGLATKLGWDYISTDSLARHPGRPWKTKERAVPDHVADHYLSLSVDELITDVLRHYRTNVWPKVVEIVANRVGDSTATPLVLEGSALWPESVATLALDGVAAIWLTASPTLLQKRIHASSHFHTATPREQAMVEKFLQRTHRYNERMMAVIDRLGLVSLDIETISPEDDLANQCLQLLRCQRQMRLQKN